MENALNLADIIKEEHEKKWVALSKDKSRIVGFDESLVELRRKIGSEKVVFMKIPSGDVYLSL